MESCNRTFNWDDQGWRDQAACRHTATALFFPAGNSGPAISEIRAAKKVCESCAVQGACLRFALDTNQESGIWGGKGEAERHRIRVARRPPSWLRDR